MVRGLVVRGLVVGSKLRAPSSEEKQREGMFNSHWKAKRPRVASLKILTRPQSSVLPKLCSQEKSQVKVIGHWKNGRNIVIKFPALLLLDSPLS